MSADMEIWNAGASQASVMRRAIVLRIWFSFTTSISPLGAAAAVAAPVADARSTSSATMRPSGPVPRSEASSMPRSRAMRRASGEALTLPPFVLSTRCSGSDGPSGASSRPRSRSSSRSCAGDPSSWASSSETSVASSASASGASSPSGTSSPSWPITAIALPTSISSPSPARIFRSTPEASASTSCVTFSVSSS
jgi:hypothetical protein